MSIIKLVDFDTLAAQVANDLFYLLEGEPAGLFEEDGVDWPAVEAVLQRVPEGMSLYGIIAREYDPYNMVTFGILVIICEDDFDAMQREMQRLRDSWESQFGEPNKFCAAGAYAIARRGMLDG